MTSGERVEPVERFTLNACEDCAAHHSTQPRWGCQHFDDRTESIEVLPTQALLALVEKWETEAQELDDGWASRQPSSVSAYRRAAEDLRQLLDPPEGSSK